jgi:nitrate reductase NapE component
LSWPWRRSGTAASPDSNGVSVYAEFVKGELAAQDKRKESFEQRGLAVVTTSGGLVTLLFALGALSTKKQATFELTGHAPRFLAIALVLFFLAAVAALLTNMPIRYAVPGADSIREMLEKADRRTEDHALKAVTRARLDSLVDAKSKNRRKARLLFLAICLEVAAVAFVGAAIWVVIDP